MTRRPVSAATLRMRLDELLTASASLPPDEIDAFLAHARRQVNAAADRAAWSRPAPTRDGGVWRDTGYRR